MVGQMLQAHLSLRLTVVSVWWLSEEVTQVLLLCFSQSQAEAAEGFGPSFGQKLKQLPGPLVRCVFGLQNREQNREAWDILRQAPTICPQLLFNTKSKALMMQKKAKSKLLNRHWENYLSKTKIYCFYFNMFKRNLLRFGWTQFNLHAPLNRIFTLSLKINIQLGKS